MISFFNGDLSRSVSYAFTGRMLANNPKDFLSFNKPCSGLTFAEGSLSYLGCPIDPNNIASEDMQSSSVSSGKGFPVLSIAIAPTLASSKINVWSNSEAIAFNTLIASLVTSGPIPSPGRVAIFNFIFFCFRKEWKYKILIYNNYFL